MNYAVLATIVLLLHALFVAFVVLMLPCIFFGKRRGWQWVRHFWLRVAHLAGVCIVAAQAWAGVVCPLTTLEMRFRELGQQSTYAAGFIEYWLQTLLYWNLPAWVFIAAYSVFAVLVVAAWYVVPPTRS